MATYGGTDGTWIILPHSIDAIANRRTSVIVDAQAGLGSLTSCLAVLHAALDVLEALGCEQGDTPAGVDWLSQDLDGRWRLNPVDSGLWTVDPTRDWRLAVYDVVWTVALGRKPTMRDQPPYRVITDCPWWLSEFLVRLAGHDGEEIRSIPHARQSLRGSRSRRNLKRLLVVASIIAGVSVATVWWMDARTVRYAVGIAGQSDRSSFERRNDLAEHIAQHPVLLFGRSTVNALRQQLNDDCEKRVEDWKVLATTLLEKTSARNAETLNRFQTLIDQATHFKSEVAATEASLRKGLSEIRVVMLLDSREPPITAIIEAAQDLRSHDRYSSDLLRRLMTVFDESRWQQAAKPPPVGASVQEVDQHLVALRVYLADADADAAFGEKYRHHAEEANQRIIEALEHRQRAKLAELDQIIDQGKRAGNLAVAVARLLQLRREPDQPVSFQAALKQRASELSALQVVKLSTMGQAKSPLSDIAKVILDWDKLVRADPEIFPMAGIEELAVKFVARDFALRILSSKAASEMPSAGDSVRGALSLAGGTIQDRLMQAYDLQSAWLHSAGTYADLNRSWHARWTLRQISDQLQLPFESSINRYPASRIRVQLLAAVEDHWGNDWIVSVRTGGALAVEHAGREIAGKRGQPIDFPLRIHAGEDLFVPDGHEAEITVWDDDFGPDDPILLQGKMIFRKDGVEVRPILGRAAAVRVQLVR